MLSHPPVPIATVEDALASHDMASAEIMSVDFPRRYVSLPISDGSEMKCEGICYSSEFRPGSVFVPVSSEDKDSCGLYQISLNASSADPVTKVADLTPGHNYFGCVLTAEGFCVMCVVNKAMVIAVDLKVAAPTESVVALFEADFWPNDLALDRPNKRLLVAGNLLPNKPIGSDEADFLNALELVGKGNGSVFAVSYDFGTGKSPVEPTEPTIFVDGLRILAGSIVAEKDQALWLSELNSLIKVPLKPASTRDWTRLAPFDRKLLADNLEIDTNTNSLIFPYYRKVSEIEAAIGTNQPLSNCLYEVLSCCPCIIKPITEAAGGSEASEENGQLADVLFGVYNINNEKMQSYRMPILNPDFDGMCTACEKVGKELVFVNYLKKEVLFLDASSIFAS